MAALAANAASPDSTQGHFTVLYFASAASFTRRDRDLFPAPMTIDHLCKALEKSYPGITKAILQSSAMTLNLEYINTDAELFNEDMANTATLIREADEVAIIPPVSSG